MYRCIIAGSLVATTAAAAAPGVTLEPGRVAATLTTEINASHDAMGSPSSVAPDLAVGVTGDLTLALVHSTFATTGFRGAAGGGVCVAERCANTYDNAGVEGTYNLVRGAFAAGVTAGVIATSFEQDREAAKLGAKLRWRSGRLTIASAPSVFVALRHRDDAMPNRDRLFLPVAAQVRVAGGLALGGATGFKAPLDDVARGYEIAAGALATLALAPEWTVGASWVHGKLFGGEAAIPDGAHGYDFRALHFWVTFTR